MQLKQGGMLGRNNQLGNGMGNKIGMQNGFPPP